MLLIRLAYISRPSPGVSFSDVEQIVETAQARNAELGITGVLAYRHDLFVQILEGDRRAVSDIYGLIAADKRHTDVVVLGAAPIERRLFTQWTMRYLSLADVNLATIHRYCGLPRFEPTMLSYDALVSVMTEISAAQPPVEPRSG